MLWSLRWTQCWTAEYWLLFYWWWIGKFRGLSPLYWCIVYVFCRRGLTKLPVLALETQVRLLSLQHNLITTLDGVPTQGLARLVFLDIYDNQLERITGLDSLQNLRVLLVGKNRWVLYVILCDLNSAVMHTWSNFQSMWSYHYVFSQMTTDMFDARKMSRWSGKIAVYSEWLYMQLHEWLMREHKFLRLACHFIITWWFFRF